LMIAVLIAGLIVGILHLDIAIAAIVLFPDGEPLTSWVAVLLGPGVTLLAIFVAAFRRFAGGVVLLAATAISTTAFVVSDGPAYENVTGFLWRIALPMLVLGATCIALSRPRKEARAA
jgi:hypothetical protein